MILTLSQTTTAVGPNIPSSFLATGGTGPYIYSVTPGGAGGTINVANGAYLAPANVNSDQSKLYDFIVVTDSKGITASQRILVGTPLLLMCEIIQKQLGLSDRRVYLWDQKLFQPTDDRLYIAVSVPSCRPFANVNRAASSGGPLQSQQYVAMQAQVDIDAISRGPEARDRKEEIILALNSTYAQQQQEINSFYIGKLPSNGRFVNLSDVDGAAIPYRYKITINLIYSFTKNTAISYFDNFTTQGPYTNP